MSGKRRRKLKNLWINPKFQGKFTLYFIVSGLFIFGFMFYIIFDVLVTIREFMSQAQFNDAKLLSLITDSFQTVSVMTLLAFLAFACLAILYSVTVTHRVAGPMVAINKFIDDLIAGNYERELILRKYDELTEIADKLNELKDKLKENKK